MKHSLAIFDLDGTILYTLVAWITGGCGEKSSCARYLRIVLGSAPVFLEISLIRYPQLLKSLI